MIEADIDDTITFWQRRGVRMVDVAASLRCTRTWPAVRRRMVQWAITNEPGREP